MTTNEVATKTGLWDRVQKTDPAHVKPITGKQYSGNSPKPYYIVRRLTEEFGPCGVGWGFSVLNERFERFSDTDTLHVALVEFWYVGEGGGVGKFQQMGQTKASYMSNANKFILDEDAPKKSVTDALVKCASYLGFAGDIFMGLWDDSKYVNGLREEFKGGKTFQSVKTDDERPKGDPLGPFSPAWRTNFRKAAEDAIDHFNKGDEMAAYEDVTTMVAKYGTTDKGAPDEDRANMARMAIWAVLHDSPALRRAIKKIDDEQRVAA